MLETVEAFVQQLNGILFSEYVVFALLLTGLLFTIWTAFGQYRAMTHGVAVVRGKYDDPNDPGAINHFQALSTALSATVGLGNIAGVAVAVAVGGPGAILWMWVIGVIGMALKMTEVTQSMVYRRTDDPENPHGGPMFVVKNGLAEAVDQGRMGFVRVTAVVFGALIFLGGLQWSGVIPLAKQTSGPAEFMDHLQWGSLFALVVTFLVGAGLVALSFGHGKLLGSLIGGIFVITLIISAITGGNMFQAWNVADITYTYWRVPQVVPGIILTVVVGIVIIGGIKRIGRVAGALVPVMCLLYLLAGMVVIFLNIGQVPEMLALIVRSGLPEWLGGTAASPEGAFLGGTFGYAAMWGVKRALFSSEAGQGSAPIAHSAARTDEPVREGVVAGLGPFLDTLVVCTVTALVILSTGAWSRAPEAVLGGGGVGVVAVDADGDGRQDEANGEPYWTIETPALPQRSAEAQRVSGGDWEAGQGVFMLVESDLDEDTGRSVRRVTGLVARTEDGRHEVEWAAFTSSQRPVPVTDAGGGLGVYGDYAGASLTAHAFDRAIPGLGKWLIAAVAWLFALSTIISWSYYGEQGVYYLASRLGEAGTRAAILVYKVVYCLLILLTTVASMPLLRGRALIGTDKQLDDWTTLGLGVMLVANIPIMILFAPKAMSAYHDYMRRLKAGEMPQHGAHSLTDLVGGKDPGEDDEAGGR